jgi:hypothetical protein
MGIPPDKRNNIITQSVRLGCGPVPGVAPTALDACKAVECAKPWSSVDLHAVVNRLTLLFLTLALAGGWAFARGPQDDALARNAVFRAELEALIPRYQKELSAASQSAEQRRALQAEGLASRLEVEAAERVRQNLENDIADLRRRVAECDQVEVEIHLALEMEQQRSERPQEDNVIFFTGTSQWSLKGVTKLESFYEARFGVPMPISAFGQTSTHERLGFSHRESVDVALHPDSSEGQELMGYLRQAGISFIAFRRALAGSATGAHIHIGKPSLRNIPTAAKLAGSVGSGQ